MNHGMTRYAPWLLTILLVTLIAVQLAFGPSISAKESDEFVVVPIRPPLTRPSPSEALLLADDQWIAEHRAKPQTDGPREKQLADESEKLRLDIALDGYEMGRVLTMEQLLYVFSNRDRLERDDYEGRWYTDLETALMEKAKP